MLPGYGKRVPGPHFDLEAFKEELRAGNAHVYISRATQIIRRLLRCSKPRAQRYAIEAALSLEEGDFAHSIKLPTGQVHDVYGKLIQGEGWYLKIEVNANDGVPGIVSCHPAERDLATRKGIVPRSWRSDDER